ncbi:MAG: hypothetical protein LDL30_10330 [Desulfovibrio sp.]|nr:hypothetical protein [Desulfovibrio sp.]MCA1985188.1 hypothetical protein [Desulfovibrio sp.]
MTIAPETWCCGRRLAMTRRELHHALDWPGPGTPATPDNAVRRPICMDRQTAAAPA